MKILGGLRLLSGLCVQVVVILQPTIFRATVAYTYCILTINRLTDWQESVILLLNLIWIMKINLSYIWILYSIIVWILFLKFNTKLLFRLALYTTLATCPVTTSPITISPISTSFFLWVMTNISWYNSTYITLPTFFRTCRSPRITRTFRTCRGVRASGCWRITGTLSF